jgi:nucleoside-diphosphate-sugar epimerase
VTGSLSVLNHRAQRPVVVITGSSGLIGTPLVHALRHEYQVVGFDRDGQPQPPKEVECVCVDVTDRASINLGLERVAYAYGRRLASVVHLAAYYDFSEEESPLYDTVTVRGTAWLLEELQRQRFEVEQFLFSSTMLVHASTEPGKAITEEAPLAGAWPYPRSKIRTERRIRELHGAIPVVLMRIAGVYTDEGRAPAIVHQIARIHQRSLEAYVYPGDVSHGQAYVHLDDAVEAIRLCIARRHRLGPVEAFLIGEPVTYSYDELQQTLGSLLHGDPEWTTRKVPQPLAKAGAWIQDQASILPGIDEPFIKPFMVELAGDHYELDIGKARAELGWEPRRRLIDTLPRMVEALKRDPTAWYRRHGLAS